MLFSTWIYPKPNPQESRTIQKAYGLSAAAAGILVSRGLRPYEIEDMINGGGELGDPFALPDMEKAAARLEEALGTGERIAVYGDYDCDGVTATVMLYSYLLSMGADVIWYIPDRLGEGYGMNRAALDTLHEKGVSLIVTVDNGISALEEAEYAASLGMELLITDHHQPGETLPRAVAVVDAHRRDYQKGYRHFCGAGVAFKLIAAMEGGDYAAAMEDFGALTAMATIGDVVPLTGENRTLVQFGMERLPYSDSPGLRELLAVSGLDGKPLTAQRIAFGLVPRINAAGRMGSAELAAQLLLCEDDEAAAELAAQLDQLNTRRKEEEEEILQKLTALVAENPSLLLSRVLVLAAEGLNHGIVGIVSSRIASLYGKPNFILSIEGEMAVGSGRSVGEFSLFKALSACSGLLERYGGHAAAAGVTLQANRIEEFSRAINAYAAQNYDRMPRETIRIDYELRGSELSLSTVEELCFLEPFGEGSPQPVFLMRDCLIEQLIPMGNGQHLKLKANFDGKPVFVVCFKTRAEQFIYKAGSRVDMLVTLEENEYRGSRGISVRLKDIRPTGFAADKMENANFYYEKIRRGEKAPPKIAAIAEPSVDELRALYKLLRQQGGAKLHLDLFYLSAAASAMNYCKYRLALDILQEKALIALAPDLSSIEILPVSGKVDIEDSAILSAIRQMRG